MAFLCASISDRKHRFAEFTDNEIKERLIVPRNIRKNTEWAGRVWDTWAKERNAYRESTSHFPSVPKLDNMMGVKHEDLKIFLIHVVVKALSMETCIMPVDSVIVIVPVLLMYHSLSSSPECTCVCIVRVYKCVYGSKKANSRVSCVYGFKKQNRQHK